MESGGRREKGKGGGEERDEGKMLWHNQTIIKLLRFGACICTQIGWLTWLCMGTRYRQTLLLYETLLACPYALHIL